MEAKNGDAVFQRMMEDLLGPVLDCLDPFVGDIIIWSGTEDMSEDELIKADEKDLGRVLHVLDGHQMLCKPTKASLLVKEVEFAGHLVGHGQRRSMPAKFAALKHWGRPTTIIELPSFMGFCDYYTGYVRMYAELSGPLHKMLQVGKIDGRKGSKKRLAWTTRRKERWRRSGELSWESCGYSLSIWTKDSCSAPMNRIMQSELSWSKSERMVPMYQWPFGVDLWRRGNAALGLRGKRRRMPLSAPCASGPGILVCNPLLCAPTIKVSTVGTRSTWTPSQVRQPNAPGGTRRQPSLT